MDNPRWLPVLGFNTKEWWIFDEQDNCYVDIPVCVFEEMDLQGFTEQDEEDDFLFDLCNAEEPDWLFDEDYRYYDEDFEI